MTADDPDGPDRFRLLATFLAGRSVQIAWSETGMAAHTTGRTIFITSGRPGVEQRREVLVQAALLGAGSLAPPVVKALRRRPTLARRYLALEGQRVLAQLPDPVLRAAELPCGRKTGTATAEESLAVARTRRPVADPPDWFGVIDPSLLCIGDIAASARPSDRQLLLDSDEPGESAADDEQTRDGEIGNLFRNPLFSVRSLMNFFRNERGSMRAAVAGAGPAGAGTSARTVPRGGRRIGADRTRPWKTHIRFTDDGMPSVVAGVSGILYPEWDVHRRRYRPEWCRVVDFPVTAEADNLAEGVSRDDMLRRRLARVGTGSTMLRGRPEGDEFDTEALIGLFVDLRSGYSPREHIYSERRKLARDLGVLILLDASGSATDADHNGFTVHDHQRRAAATLAVTLEELGDRVAVYAFRSHGRQAIQLSAIKTFGQRFGAAGQARLNRTRPSGYTRLGAGIRGAGDILKTRSGTQNRLLLLLSDGLPYEDGYDGRYAEADTRKAVEELRGDGVGCLCLSLGGETDAEMLERIFGAAGYATAATLAELSPRMDELFLAGIREFSAPKPRRG
ncbi:nitric oxide reductase activation protein NorD [Nocardia carnea]|uniref:nitric oxide reductase activation protein NorD n=1 Tax=Nocardia carnea TaxID=37328 RepID=UPI002456263D|nr:VWA domain-containing protein [Nocardia carnea]